MITEIEDYFAKGCGRCARFDTADCSTRRWAIGLAALRRLVVDAGLVEMVKWGHPCYMHAGRNILIFGAFRDDFRLTFFNAALMRDPEGLLEVQGPNSAQPGMIRFTANGQVREREAAIQGYIREAMGYADAGVLPVKVAREVVLPDALVEAMDADPEMAEAFWALTPGRQRSYVIHLASAKTSATRVARVERVRGKILAGKGALER